MSNQPNSDPIVPNPVSRWKKNELHQQHLSAFLVSEAGQSFLEALRYLAAPQSPVPPGFQGEDAVASRALQYSELVGYHNAVQNIMALATTAHLAQPAPLPKPWQGSRLQHTQD